MKFGITKPGSQANEKIPIKPGKQEVKDASEKPKPKNSIFADMLAKAAATKTYDSSNDMKWTRPVDKKIESSNTDGRVLDEPKMCPSSFTEIDIATKMKELEGSIDDLEEYDIIGAELSIFDIESLAKNNDIPKITTGDTNGNKAPLKGSLNDPRMGVVENNAICETCGGDNIQCPGHFGYIKLNTPIYHPLFAPLIPKILSSICITCGLPYLTEEMMKEKGIFNYHADKRINNLAEESSNQMCQRCNDSRRQHSDDGEGSTVESRKRKIKGCPGTHIPFVWNKDCMNIQALIGENVVLKGVNLEQESQPEREKNKKPKGRTVPITDVMKILKGLDEKTVSLLGFSNHAHPKSFIIEYFPVLPPISRQPKFIDGKVIEDKLTEQYRTIISKNDAVGSSKNENKATASRALYDEIDKFIQGSDSGKKGEFKSIK